MPIKTINFTLAGVSPRPKRMTQTSKLLSEIKTKMLEWKPELPEMQISLESEKEAKALLRGLRLNLNEKVYKTWRSGQDVVIARIVDSEEISTKPAKKK